MSHSVAVFKKMADIEALAEFAHRNQTDRAGYPYIKHPMRVMNTIKDMGLPPYAQMAAVLHDVTEDTAFTPQMLIDLGVPEAAVEIVKLMDRGYSEKVWSGLKTPIENKTDFVKEQIDNFYYAELKANEMARQVKLADITDNTQPWRVSYLNDATRARLAEKYRKAREMLGA